MHHGGFMRVLYLFSLFSFLLDIYAYNGVKTWVSGWKSVRRQKIALRTYLLFFAGVTILLLADIMRFFWGVVRRLIKPKPVPRGPFFPSRRRFIAEAGILLAAVPFTG